MSAGAAAARCNGCTSTDSESRTASSAPKRWSRDHDRDGREREEREPRERARPAVEEGRRFVDHAGLRGEKRGSPPGELRGAGFRAGTGLNRW